MPEQHGVMKPRPRVNEVSEPFWRGVNEGRIRVQQCTGSSCARVIFYPRVCCPFCHAPDLKWIDTTGHGHIVSNTTIYRTHHDGFNADQPYVFVAVELDEGVLFYGQLPGAPTDGGSLIGRKVTADFVAHGTEGKMVVFRLV
jgi:uncharacterized OB-fold protein